MNPTSLTPPILRRPAARRAVLAVYLAVMIAALLLPVPGASSVPGDFDKAAHVALFLGFALLAAWAVRGPRLARITKAVVAGALLAALTELIQSPLPYRSGDPVDLLAGVGGALLGAALGGWTSPPAE
jgi:VanZ family protein